VGAPGRGGGAVSSFLAWRGGLRGGGGRVRAGEREKTQQNVGAVFNPRVWVGDPGSLRLAGPAGQRQQHPYGLADGSPPPGGASCAGPLGGQLVTDRAGSIISPGR
jgi:hypothetical protein